MERTGTRIIRTASVETVLSPWFLRQIGLRIDALGLSRLKTTGWLSDTIWNWEGRILDASGGNLLRDPDIVETAYGGEESCRRRGACVCGGRQHSFLSLAMSRIDYEAAWYS